MSLKSLINYISNTQITSEILNKIQENNQLNIIGSSRYAKSILIESIAKKENKDILLVAPNTETAFKWYGYFEAINNNNVLYYPPNENLPYSSINKSKENEYQQLSVLSKLLNSKQINNNILITTERALQPHLIDKKLI